MSAKTELQKMLLHNHSTTNIAFIGLRPPGECSACDYERSRR